MSDIVMIKTPDFPKE